MSNEAEKLAEVFSFLFVLSQRVEYLADSFLKKENLTTKQLLTLIAIGNASSEEPSVSEVAEIMSTSHQNVTQIALNLQKRGFVEVFKDPKDRRRSLLKLTEANEIFWEENSQQNYDNLKSIFSTLNKDELNEFLRLLTKIVIDMQELYEEIRG